MDFVSSRRQTGIWALSFATADTSECLFTTTEGIHTWRLLKGKYFVTHYSCIAPPGFFYRIVPAAGLSQEEFFDCTTPSVRVSSERL